jgi:hypothetical protein
VKVHSSRGCTGSILQSCAADSTSLDISRRSVQGSQELQKLIIFEVKLHSIQNTPPELQVISAAPEHACAASGSTVVSSRGVWEHPEKLQSTGVGARCVWEDCMLLLNRFPFCLCAITQILNLLYWEQ